MPSRTVVPPPPPVLAAFVLVMLFVVGSIGIAVVLAVNGFWYGLFVGGFGLLISGFVAHGLWFGKRRGSQILAIVFGVLLMGMGCSNPQAAAVTAPIGLAIILLVTVAPSARAWFEFRR